MENLKCMLSKAGFPVTEDVKDGGLCVYKSVQDIHYPLSRSEILRGCAGYITKDGAYRYISDDAAVVKLANRFRSSLEPFSKQLTKLFYMDGHRKVLEWLLKNKDSVKVIPNEAGRSFVCIYLMYEKTYAKFRFDTQTWDDKRSIDETRFGTLNLKTADEIIQALERLKKSLDFIPLYVERKVASVVVKDGDGFSKNCYLGSNLLDMPNFKVDYAEWLKKGFRVSPGVWYIACWSKNVGRYLKRNNQMSPKVQS